MPLALIQIALQAINSEAFWSQCDHSCTATWDAPDRNNLKLAAGLVAAFTLGQKVMGSRSATTAGLGSAYPDNADWVDSSTTAMVHARQDLRHAY